MPIYSFRCKKCDMEFDFLVGVSSEEVDLKCPGCDNTEVVKSFASFAVGSSGSKKEMPCAAAGGCPMPMGGAGGCGGCCH